MPRFGRVPENPLMHLEQDLHNIRRAIALIPTDISSDAVGQHVPKLEDMYTPEKQLAALDPGTPIVVGSRGTGKSFWAGVLGQDETRLAAGRVYPSLHLAKLVVRFGFTGVIGGPTGVSTEHLTSFVDSDTSALAKGFWWATILRAAASVEGNPPKFSEIKAIALDVEAREEHLQNYERTLSNNGQTLLVVYDALDAVATTWTRRRMLTEALVEVVWAMRAYRAIKLKLFLRPDQIDDDALRFVELPKLRTGAVRLKWSGTDLYGMLFARLALAPNEETRKSFAKLLNTYGISVPDREEVLSRKWSLCNQLEQQALLMNALAGPYMAQGVNGYKKGKTYEWPLNHLADALDEVTPRSFLGLMVSASQFGTPPLNRALSPEGIQHGLRAASKTRVDQLHQEFQWIKGVLAPLAGLLLPGIESDVFQAWKKTETLQNLELDAEKNKYLPPFDTDTGASESDLFEALKRIGVMFRRKDDRIDMPDLYRVAAKLLKKGATAPT